MNRRDFLQKTSLLGGSQRILSYQGTFDGEGYEHMKGAALDEMRHHFRPEFLNRIDEIVTFGALGEDEIRKIVEIQFQDLKKRVLEKKIDNPVRLVLVP